MALYKFRIMIISIIDQKHSEYSDSYQLMLMTINNVCCAAARSVPARIHELINITRNEGLAATLVCRSHGDPAPEMKFRKMDSDYEFNATNVSLQRRPRKTAVKVHP